MKRLKLAALAVSGLFPTILCAQKAPNVIIILLDDMGYGDLSVRKLLILLPALSLMLAAFAKPEPLNETIQIQRDESTKKRMILKNIRKNILKRSMKS